MNRPEAQLIWRGIEFVWSPPTNGYIADTSHGRWMVLRHANDDGQWFARFGPYAGAWRSAPERALADVWAVALNAHARAIEYLKGMPS